MTHETTSEEWAKIIKHAEHGLEISTNPYPCPEVGSEAFIKTIDHTLLKLDATTEQFDALCAEAKHHKFATVCIRPEHVERCVTHLEGSGVEVASVIAFHEGTYPLPHKIQEITRAVSSGAHELDIVLNYPLLKLSPPNYTALFSGLSTLREHAGKSVRCKLILETSQLSRSQIIAGCVLAAATGFDFVKTSTGFNGHGAKVEDVRLMRACCEKLATSKLGQHGGEKRQVMQVKASGGIRSLSDAVAMLEAGATRLGTSGGVTIAKEAAAATGAGLAAAGQGAEPGKAPVAGGGSDY